MRRFVKANGKHENTDMVKGTNRLGAGTAYAALRDETEHLSGLTAIGDRIIQVVPVAVPTFALYETENITARGMVIATEEEVHYLALTDSGDIKPLILTGECYEFADSIEAYLGMYESAG